MSVLLVAFEGYTAPDGVLRLVREGAVAGVALYHALNVADPAQLRNLGDAVQAAAREGGQDTAIVAIDQEGGQLQALGMASTPFAGNLALGAAGSPDLARRVGAATGRELAACGCTVAWAPVCDLATLPASPSVGARAFGDDPVAAAALVGAIVEGIQSTGVAATLKHFPGSGELDLDPHDALPVVQATADVLEDRELVPFRAGLEAGARLVMVSHAAYPGLEPAGAATIPARGSSAVLKGLLRDRMAFRGVVVTDALDMGALDQADVVGASVRAVRAGADVLLAGPGQARRPEVVAAIRQALAADPAAEPAMARIRELRRWLGAEPAQPVAVVGSREHAALAAELASRSVTLIRDRERQLPLHLDPERRILVVTPRPADLTPADTSSLVRVRLADAVRRRHPRTDSLEVSIDPDAPEIAAVVGRAAGAALVVLGTINAFVQSGQLELARALARTGTPVVMVAMRMPTDVDVVPELPAALCSYSIHDPSTEAVAAVLFGELAATGRSPIRLHTA